MLKYLTFLCRPLSPYSIIQQKLNSSFFLREQRPCMQFWKLFCYLVSQCHKPFSGSFNATILTDTNPSSIPKPLIFRLSLDLPARLASNAREPDLFHG